jgi:predicted TIM-barrel enzyme
MAGIARAEILRRLQGQIAAGRPIVGCGAGTGISAKFAEAGGADLIIIYNSGRYRMAGRGSLAGLLPYGDANAIVVEMSAEVLPVVKDTPVLAGVCGTDPFRLLPVFLQELKRIGFSGVQNFPTVGLFDGNFRANLEGTGMGYDKEVEMIRLAHELDLFTSPYAFTPDEARAMTDAGCDLLVCHVGLDHGGQHRRGAGVHVGRGHRPRDGHGRSRLGAAPRPDGDLSRRPLRRTGECRRGAQADAGDRRLLRRIEHRAPAHRTRHPRPGGGVQGAGASSQSLIS